MTLLRRPTNRADRPETCPAFRVLGRTLLLGFAYVLPGAAGVTPSVSAAPGDPVAFPAAKIRPEPAFIGPMPEVSGLGAVGPEDAVILDYDSTEIDVINSTGSTAGSGTRTVVASASLGSGTPFTTKVNLGVVSPQQLYYRDNTAKSLYAIDLTTSAYRRAQAIQPANPALRPYGVQGPFLVLA